MPIGCPLFASTTRSLNRRIASHGLSYARTVDRGDDQAFQQLESDTSLRNPPSCLVVLHVMRALVAAALMGLLAGCGSVPVAAPHRPDTSPICTCPVDPR